MHDVATDAAYFHSALSLDIHDIDAAKAWAFDIVAREDAPDIRIIEVATANDAVAGISALSALTEGADTHEVADRLFRVVHARLADDTLTVDDAAALSQRICTALALPIAVHVLFDRVATMLRLSGDDLAANRPPIRQILLSTLSSWNV